VAKSLLETEGKTSMLIPADIVAQRRYVRAARHFPPNSGLAIGSTVLRGLRDLGFRDTAAALCALIDNAIDAGARLIDVVVECDGSRPTALALIDNGYGMVPEMMRAASALGVTCRLGDGPHLARNGFGLPAAPFAIGQRFDLFSCARGDALRQVTIDLETLDDRESLPEPRRAELPTFVAAYVARHARTWTSGTIVMVSDLDRLAPRSATALRADLRHHLGYVFSHYMPDVTFRLDGETIAPVDPLFLTPGAVGFALDRARAIDTGRFAVAVDGASLTVRTARLPAGFCSFDKARDSTGANGNARAAIVRETNGFIISRLGRRLVMVESSPLFTFTNADRFVRVELDFSPELDDLLAPSLSLHQVRIAGDIWQGLRQAGLGAHLQQIRRQVHDDRVSKRHPDAAVSAIPMRASSRRRNRCQK
jgi:hypothetical protein